MKNLLCVVIFCLGLVTISQAQTLRYQVNNNSTVNWYWAMYDAGPSATQYELNILPSQTRFGGVTNFSFPLTWKAGTYSSPNCYVTATDVGPVLATVLPTACQGVTVLYKVVEMVPFVFYLYKGVLDN